ncbi:MAG: DUF1285 domain-containing protein [Syntrophaceae bacterium]|nr:DUF1285 domain-containing protein [Syntrophaceae bacterium]
MAEDDHCDIIIDKEGNWFYRGSEMIRLDIVRYFYQHLKEDGKGAYYIEIDADRCPVQVEDLPYVIRSVTLRSQPDDETSFFVSLTDGTEERLDEEPPLRVGRDNILYGWVGGGRCEARFSRPAYYQLSRYIEYDPAEETYRVKLDHRSIPISMEKNGESDAR